MSVDARSDPARLRRDDPVARSCGELAHVRVRLACIDVVDAFPWRAMLRRDPAVGPLAHGANSRVMSNDQSPSVYRSCFYWSFNLDVVS